MTAATQSPESTALARLGLRLSDWFENWFPDAFALALAAVAIVFVASLLAGSTRARYGAVVRRRLLGPRHVHDADVDDRRDRLRRRDGAARLRGDPLARDGADDRAAARRRTSGLFSMLASLVSWSFSLIFSALLAREVAHRVRGADYRAIGAAAYLGVGSVWALGLSSSAALIMAAPASLPDAIERISGVIPLSQTLGLWQSLLIAALLIVVSMAVSYLLGARRRARAVDGRHGRHLRAGARTTSASARRRASGSSTARCSRS